MIAAPDETGRLRPADLVVTPEPTAEELAAIIAAYEQLWPRNESALAEPSPRWRYAGRPWLRRPHYGGWR